MMNLEFFAKNTNLARIVTNYRE